MIEEELKQDAEKSLDKRLGTYAYIRKQDCYTNYVDGYIDGAEPREKRIAKLEAQIEKMKKYIKACWVEENLNDYSSYITNASDEFRDLVKELNEEIRNGR